MKTSGYGKNIKLNYLYHFVMSIRITQGIWMLFLVARGLSLFEVGLLEGIFHITSFLMETPTGVVADLFSRKASRLIGVGISILSSIIMILSGSFWGFALSFVLSALSYNFESGAGEALIYDSLKAEGEEKGFIRITGYNETIFQIAGIVALIAGGIVGTIEHLFVYYIAIGLSLITLLIGIYFKEPPRLTVKEPVGFGTAIKNQYRDSFGAIRNSGRLAYLIIFSALLATMITLSFFYLQVAWKRYGFFEWQIGIILASSSLFAVAGALLAEKIDKRFGEARLLMIIPFIITSTLFMFSQIWLSIIGFAIASFVDSLLFVTLRDYINQIITSDKRATIISFESTCFSFFMILVFPVFGLLSDHINMSTSFIVLGVIMLLLSSVNRRMIKIQTKKKLEYQ